MWTWDEAKRQTNLAKHGVDFSAAEGFDWATATERPDTRQDYGEIRVRALGRIGDRVHVLIYVRRDEAMRLISLRKANDREYLEWISNASSDPT